MSEHTFVAQEKEETPISLRDLWHILFPKWRWYIASVVIALALAFGYLLVTPPTFKRSAELLVKDGKSGSNVDQSVMSGLSDFGLFPNNTNINNEILTISSPTLMTKVVERLDLQKSYYIRIGLKKIDSYKNSPITVEFKSTNFDNNCMFHIKLNDNGTFILSDFHYTLKNGKEVEDSHEVEGHIGQLVKTDLGEIQLVPTDKYKSKKRANNIDFHFSNLEQVTNYFCKHLNVSLAQKDAQVINISIQDESSQRAEDVIKTLIDVYNEYWISDKNRVAVSTSKFITNRLGIIEKELGNVDASISTFKSEHLIPNIEEASKLFMAQSSANKQALLQLNSDLSIAKMILSELKKDDINKPLPANLGLEAKDVQAQLMQYNDFILQRLKLLSSSSEENPMVVSLSKTIHSMKGAILQSVQNLIKALNIQIADLSKQEKKTTNQLASSPTQEKYLLSVERQQKVKQALYLYLLQKREETELSQAFSAYNTSLITPPRGSAYPIAPKKSLILLGALLIGLIIPTGVILLLAYSNNRLKDAHDIEGLNIPFIGEIPQYDQRKYRKRHPEKEYHIVVKDRSRNIINEAFRVTRANLEFMITKPEEKTIMFTSYNPGSGKTFLLMNMAMTFAIKGKKIIALDLDLRRSSLSKYVKLPSVGISSYLSEKIDNWRELIYDVEENPNLKVIPVGITPPNPTELLESDRLKSLIDELKMEYDYVFLDCAPIDIVADTAYIRKIAGTTVFVMRANLFEKSALSRVKDLHESKLYPNMAIILNAVEKFNGRYGYGRYGNDSYYISEE